MSHTSTISIINNEFGLYTYEINTKKYHTTATIVAIAIIAFTSKQMFEFLGDYFIITVNNSILLYKNNFIKIYIDIKAILLHSIIFYLILLLNLFFNFILFTIFL